MVSQGPWGLPGAWGRGRGCARASLGGTSCGMPGCCSEQLCLDFHTCSQSEVRLSKPTETHKAWKTTTSLGVLVCGRWICSHSRERSCWPFPWSCWPLQPGAGAGWAVLPWGSPYCQLFPLQASCDPLFPLFAGNGPSERDGWLRLDKCSFGGVHGMGFGWDGKVLAAKFISVFLSCTTPDPT